jgi:hypothetical protein
VNTAGYSYTGKYHIALEVQFFAAVIQYGLALAADFLVSRSSGRGLRFSTSSGLVRGSELRRGCSLGGASFSKL